MIDIKELRIGNWIADFGDGNGQVTAIDSSWITTTANNLSAPADIYNPIPLTEEWLTNFGWIWNEECKSWEKYPDSDTRMNLQKSNFGWEMFNYILKSRTCGQLYYVHQLQNIAFCLLGKELEIKQSS